MGAIAKNATAVAVMREVTEGVFVPPAAGGDFISVLPGIESNGKKELVSRDVLTASIGKVAPRAGLRSVEAALPAEFRGSGTEGGTPEFGLVVEAALGATRNKSARTTTKVAGNTGSVLQIPDGDIASFNKYDVLVVLEAGAHHVCFVTAVDSTLGAANITVSPARDTGSFPNSVELSKNKMYFPANSGHPSLSLSTYWGNEIWQKAWGCKVSSLGLAGFSVSKIANWDTKLLGMDFDRVDGSPAFTPSPDSETPPIIVSQACVLQSGMHLKLTEFSVNLSNSVSQVKEICDGITGERVVERTVDGAFNPYMDEDDVSQFDNFTDQTPYTLFAYAANPSGVDGELELGSVCAIVLPNCITTDIPTGDVDGLLVDQVSFSANTGDGTIPEMLVGFV